MALINVFCFGQEAYEERISLSTDRDLYISGETIWFQAVVSESEYDGDSLLSKILYLELYDQQNVNITQIKCRINKGISAGNISIPPGTVSGNYLLRAYTQYSRNFSPYFQTTILVTIINPQLPPSEDESVIKHDFVLIPEGRSMVTGITSRVALQLNPFLQNNISEISVVNESGEIILSPEPSENGLALFEFKPEANVKYAVVIEKSDGTRITKQIDVKESGIMLQCRFNGDNLNFKLANSENIRVINDLSVQAITRSRETIFEGGISTESDLEISLKELKNEVVFCILKNSDSIIDIRSVFTGSAKTNEIKPKADKDVYSPRAGITLDLDLPSEYKGHTMVSVVHTRSVFSKKNVIPWYVAYNPAFFGEAISRITYVDESLKRQIEALMIIYSEAYRNNGFAEYITSELQAEYLPDLRDAGINGVVFNKKSQIPVKDVTVYCSVIDESNQLHINKTGADGRFFFTLNHLEGIPHNVYITPATSDSVEILINSDFDVRYPASSGTIPFAIDTSFNDLLNVLYRNHQLNGIFAEFRPDTAANSIYFPLKKPEPENIIRLDDFIEMPVMQEVFSEIVPFVAIKTKNTRYSLEVYDERIKSTLTEPLVMLDGIPLFDMNQLMAIPTDLVEEITVVNRPVQSGDYVLNGLISIKTSTDNFAGIKLPVSARFIEFIGVKGECHPVFPDHVNNDKDRLPDFRTPLYWNPEVKGNRISFAASDETGDYEVTIRAFDGGKCYSGTTGFAVERQR